MDEDMISESEQMALMTAESNADSSESTFDCDSISSTGSCSSSAGQSPAPSTSSGTFINPNDITKRKDSLTLFRTRNDLDEDYDMDLEAEVNTPLFHPNRKILQPASHRKRLSELAPRSNSLSLHNTPNSLNGSSQSPGSPANSIVAQSSTPGSASPNAPVYRVLSRGRAATIRRESNCSIESEVAHEKLLKTSQQVSIGFEEFSLDDRVAEERRRTRSLTEPISIFTNAFLTHSSSPSPTQKVDNQKQCFSPSTQQIVRSNLQGYSPSPSPTPSPTRNRLMRSMSPLAARQLTKRRYGLHSGAPSDSDSESVISEPKPSKSKRVCLSPQVERPQSLTPVRGSTPSDSDTASEKQLTEEVPGPSFSVPIPVPEGQL
ncbi:hypothetical protein L596_015114 [Steinernema carpocapsae]|uniref:Uncharacterized protein n=1 Tax=Steinernema carpocapsae TaxID=34508 RepID=A0A4U5NEX2_STECR|nr:hypothetical protein L596_015114 [Steinernema carpocapsae]